MRTSRTYVGSMLTEQVPPLEPGQVGLVQWQVPQTFFARRLVIALDMQPPNLWYYMRGVGGSRRKGRRASWLHAAELLGHDPRKGRVLVTNIVIGVRSQFAGAMGIPAAAFTADAIGTTMRLDPAGPGRALSIHLHNAERSRVAGGSMLVIGTVDRVIT